MFDEVFIISFYIFLSYRQFLLLNILPYQNSDEKFMIYIYNISYVVFYKIAKFELKTSHEHGETIKTNSVKG
jgi:hypothetical protein